jgi:hypothetical protein
VQLRALAQRLDMPLEIDDRLRDSLRNMEARTAKK